MKRYIISSALLLLLVLIVAGCTQDPFSRKNVIAEDEVPNTPVPEDSEPDKEVVLIEKDDTPKLTMYEAIQRAVASEDCKGAGRIKSNGQYNLASRTWWFDIESDKCSPACVVSEDGSVEVNWRCTGLIPE